MSMKVEKRIAFSSSEAQYIASSSCGKSVLHLRWFIQSLSIKSTIEEEQVAPTILNTYSYSAVALLTKPKISERNILIEIKTHHIKTIGVEQGHRNAPYQQLHPTCSCINRKVQ